MDFSKTKLVVCDIDNTLMSKFATKLSPKTKEAILKLREKGILFGLASGRGVHEIVPNYKKWEFDEQFDLLVCMNGAQIYDNLDQTNESYNQMTKEMVNEVIEIMDHFDYAYSLFCGDGIIYHNRISGSIAESMQRAGVKDIHLIEDIDALLEVGIFKFLYRVPPEEMPNVEKYVDDLHLQDVRGFRTQPFCYEFTDARNGKSFGVKKFCEKHNISLDEVIAFGDTSNDNDMLACCYGVCLLNGTDDTKACAKEITEKECEDDGFADYLDKHLFNVI